MDGVAVRTEIEGLKRVTGYAEGRIEVLQEQCEHKFERLWAKLSKEVRLYRVIGYKCIFCAKTTERKSTRNCYVCDGPMESLGYVPGQGDGYHLQRCTICGRRSDAEHRWGICRQEIPKDELIEE